MNETYQFYVTAFQDEPASVLVNMELAENAPDESRPELVIIHVAPEGASEGGLPNHEDVEAVGEIEQALIEKLETVGMVHVGRLTMPQGHFLHFYAKAAPDETVKGLIAKEMGKRTFDYMVEHDPDWNTYLEILLPTNLEMQQMHTFALLDTLREKGEDLARERLLAHWAYFEDEDGRKAFVEKIEAIGFATVDMIEPGDESDNYGILFTRKDCLKPEHIHELVADLCGLAEESGGEYDGWEPQGAVEGQA